MSEMLKNFGRDIQSLLFMTIFTEFLNTNRKNLQVLKKYSTHTGKVLTVFDNVLRKRQCKFTPMSIKLGTLVAVRNKLNGY